MASGTPPSQTFWKCSCHSLAKRRSSFALATARSVGEKPGSLSSGVGSGTVVGLSLVSLVYGVAL